MAASAPWRHILVASDATLNDALRVLDGGGLRLVMVVDAAGCLLGILTDGDVRRALLNRVGLDAQVSSVMNAQPRTALAGQPKEVLRKLMEAHSLLHIPLVDADGVLQGLETYHNLLAAPRCDTPVFLMAGGFGTRLRPLTDDCPKPLLNVGGKPILESILESFIAAGFHRFYISVHYLAERIKQHFGDGDRWGVSIKYVEEDTPLGTGGALGLLPDLGEEPVIVMNGDVLTRLDPAALLDFHLSQQSAMTLCVREYDMQVPFGVVEGSDMQVTGIVEKPVHRFFVNAGIYVVSPEAIARVRPPRRIDMPDLVQSILGDGRKVAMFPIHEYWLDIGRPDDFKRAQTDF